MPTTSPTGSTMEDEVAYLSGVAADGTAAAISGQTWTGDGPDSTNPTTAATYSTTTSKATKWGADETPGTSGGTQGYYFDPNSNWTPAEQAVFSDGLALWSAESNIQFVQVQDRSAATLDFIRGSDGGAYEGGSTTAGVPIGSPTLGNQGSGAFISIDTSPTAFGALSFSTNILAVSVVVHEEGHYLGFIHGGPYNGNVNSAVQQYSPYDTLLNTTMSYIRPEDTTAKFYNSYPVSGTNFVGEPTTPQMLDILAAQRLYGAPTSGPLLVGQTFGFHTTITGLVQPFFDFTINIHPVVTLFDMGTGNTLDLSGYSTDEMVNLNAGTFSSFDGMVNNLGIAFGTAIDSFVGGGANDTVTTNANPDTLDGGAGINLAKFAGVLADYTLGLVGGVTTVINKVTNVIDRLTNFQTLQFADQSVSAVCYASGTLILTASGEIAVEDLAIGDLVVTSSGEQRPIRWLGHRTLDCRNHAEPQQAHPIRIARHAFGQNKPAQDLYVSPGHSICVDVLGQVLIPACRLANGSTIAQVDVDQITYWHVELDSHDILIANGLPAESYLDMGNKRFFVESDVVDFAVSPDGDISDLAERTTADFCLPFVVDGPILAAVRLQLRRRAEAMNWALEASERLGDLHLVIDGNRIDPVVRGLTARFMVPAGAGDGCLVSTTARPFDVSGEDDARQLGVCLTGLTIDDGFGERRAVALDDPLLGDGLHELEDSCRRWTAGRAHLPAALWDGCCEEFFLLVEIHVPALPRWVRTPTQAVAVSQRDAVQPASLGSP